MALRALDVTISLLAHFGKCYRWRFVCESTQTPFQVARAPLTVFWLLSTWIRKIHPKRARTRPSVKILFETVSVFNTGDIVFCSWTWYPVHICLHVFNALTWRCSRRGPGCTIQTLFVALTGLRHASLGDTPVTPVWVEENMWPLSNKG